MTEFRLQVRIPDELHERLDRAALADGVSVSEFVRRATADRIERRTISQLASAIADKVSAEVVREIDSLFQEALASREEQSATYPSQARPFDRGCTDADLHRPGTRCPGCGGSFYT
jgi:hypothetical protein